MPGGAHGRATATDAASAVTDWSARFDRLAARTDLEPRELDDLGLAAWFLGRLDACESAWDAAHRAYLDAGETLPAARCVFWLAFVLGESGQPVRARAWAHRLLELCAQHAEGAGEVEALALLFRSVAADADGDAAHAVALGEEALALAAAAHADDIRVLATMRLGLALLHAGRYAEAFSRLDDVMLRIRAGSVGDRVAGPAYCAVIAGCLDRRDLERAAAWTRDLSAWCDAQRGLEPFRGECAVNRASVLDLAGEWDEALALLTDVVARERRPATLEDAWYALGDLYRRRGRPAEAESAFRTAATLGREVQPGLGLLRRDAGKVAAARSGVARAVDAEPPPGALSALLAAQVDLACARADTDTAHTAALRLRALADRWDTPCLVALADRADGCVLLSSGDAQQAVSILRRAWSCWRALDAPYDGALTRILLGSAARALGDEDAAQLEFDAARTALTVLGALPDLARLERLAAAVTAPGADTGLSRREVDVIRLIAEGCSNRSIAERLFLSERTVARHVSNILTKLGLSNRAAATAFAFAHGLLDAR